MAEKQVDDELIKIVFFLYKLCSVGSTRNQLYSREKDLENDDVAGPKVYTEFVMSNVSLPL